MRNEEITLHTIQRVSSSKLALLKIPSGNDFIVGRMYIAEGQEVKPTILLLHGFPGTLLNLDIAAELQQQGLNVLVINYRGSWGSQGTFSFAHSLEDVRATLSYMKQQEVSAENRIDISRIAIVGYSFGGFLALKTASVDPSIQVVASLSGANFAQYVQMIEKKPTLSEPVMAMLHDCSFFLNGCSGESLMEEIRQYEKEWNMLLFAPQLANKKMLLTAATYDEDVPKSFFHDPFVQVLEKENIVFDNIVFETDHSYLNKRKELTMALYEWLMENL